jgi:hypothetical protein
MRMIGIQLAIAFALAPAARAQAPSNAVLAQELFEQARALAAADNWAAACPKFAASLRYDPALGTKLNLATCYEKTGKLASAWSLYRDAAELAAKTGDNRRHDYAASHAAALEPRLPRLTITAPSPAPAELAVTRDGTRIDPAALGVALYVDAGPHAIVASAPGYKAFTTATTATEGRSLTVAIPPLQAQPVPVATLAKPMPSAPLLAPARSRTRTIVAIGAAGTGVILAGVGLGFGVAASHAFDRAKAACADLDCTDTAAYERGQADVRDARHDATMSTVLTIAGAAAIAGGAVVWLISPSSQRSETARLSASATPSSLGLVLGGSF